LLLDDRHRDIARIALAAAGRKYEVAFAGGGALQIHDVSARRTQDVDLFVRKARNVVRAADVIANALERVGYRVEAVNADAQGWVDLSQELREFEVYPPGGGDPVQVQVAFFAYTGTITTDVGPVVTLDYLAARKIVALHVDQVADERLARELPPGKTPGWVRAVFADWPRYPVHADDPLG
jgi:hypothetical protein